MHLAPAPAPRSKEKAAGGGASAETPQSSREPRLFGKSFCGAVSVETRTQNIARHREDRTLLLFAGPGILKGPQPLPDALAETSALHRIMAEGSANPGMEGDEAKDPGATRRSLPWTISANLWQTEQKEQEQMGWGGGGSVAPETGLGVESVAKRGRRGGEGSDAIYRGAETAPWWIRCVKSAPNRVA